MHERLGPARALCSRHTLVGKNVASPVLPGVSTRRTVPRLLANEPSVMLEMAKLQDTCGVQVGVMRAGGRHWSDLG